MLYLIGLGLNERGISKEGMLALEKCKKVFLESYTVDFPYALEELKLGKNEKLKITSLTRADVESNMLIKEAKSRPVALLVYGCPLFATTHTSLLLDAWAQGVKTRVIYSASVFDAIAETGLQLYKFGKIASMPAWDFKKNYKPSSFLDIVKDNLGIKAHSLILVDIGLKLSLALEELEQALEDKKIDIDKIILCSNLGTEDSRIYFDTLENLKAIKEIKLPFCIIIPSDLHFLEKDFLEKIKYEIK
ncbi:diphthine synthase [Candidatus Pacearchaeota archaeon]|nr:diphthine synthase [Candidatus Pacearchaeota archaeon]